MASRKRRVRWITPEQARALLSELPLHQREIVILALATGLRQSNVVKLTWSQVDLERGTAWIYGDKAKGKEDIHVSLSQRDDWPQASVYVTELMGSETFVIVQWRDAKLTARAGGDFRAEPDRPLWIEFDTTKAHFFDAETGLRL